MKKEKLSIEPIFKRVLFRNLSVKLQILIHKILDIFPRLKFSSSFEKVIGLVAGIATIITAVFGFYQYFRVDPREELITKGTLWSADNFLDAVRLGDTKAIVLFLEGGMSPYTVNTGKLALPVQLAVNSTNPKEVLDVLL